MAEAAVPARLLPPPCQTQGFTRVLIPFLQPAPVGAAPGRDVRGGPKPQLGKPRHRGTAGDRAPCEGQGPFGCPGRAGWVSRARITPKLGPQSC